MSDTWFEWLGIAHLRMRQTSLFLLHPVQSEWKQQIDWRCDYGSVLNLYPFPPCRNFSATACCRLLRDRKCSCSSARAKAASVLSCARYARQQTRGIRVASRTCRWTGRTKAETSATAEDSVRTHPQSKKNKSTLNVKLRLDATFFLYGQEKSS